MMYSSDNLTVSYDNIRNRELGAALLKKTHTTVVCAEVICAVYFGPVREVPLFLYYVYVHRLRWNSLPLISVTSNSYLFVAHNNCSKVYKLFSTFLNQGSLIEVRRHLRSTSNLLKNSKWIWVESGFNMHLPTVCCWKQRQRFPLGGKSLDSDEDTVVLKY